MWDIERLGRPLVVLVVGAIAATGCGGDGDADPAVTDPDVAVDGSIADGSIAGGSDGSDAGADPAGLTIEGLCDPLDEVVIGWVSGDVERRHNALFAADDPASLVCEWHRSPEYREIRIVYHASPAVWDATVASGGVALDAVEAENLYDDEILSVRADNGWTIDVAAFEGDPPDHADVPDVVAPIANAAVAATR
jgi:hypothetical protein